MFCQNCGVKINCGSSFCSSCGQRIDAIPIPIKKEKRKFDFGREYPLWLIISVAIIFIAFSFAFENHLAVFIFAIIFGSISSLIITLLRKEYVAPTKKEDTVKILAPPKLDKKKKRGLMWAGYALAGLIFVTAGQYYKGTFGEIISPLIGILAGILYYNLCIKYYYKRNIEIYLFPILLLSASFLIGFMSVALKALVLWWAYR